jgi:hypothetical protein
MEWAAIIRDMIIGLLIAGATAAWVPDSFWRAFFFEGHPLAANFNSERDSLSGSPRAGLLRFVR